MSDVAAKLKQGQNLSFEESKSLFSDLMEGKHSEIQIIEISSTFNSPKFLNAHFLFPIFNSFVKFLHFSNKHSLLLTVVLLKKIHIVKVHIIILKSKNNYLKFTN